MSTIRCHTCQTMLKLDREIKKDKYMTNFAYWCSKDPIWGKFSSETGIKMQKLKEREKGHLVQWDFSEWEYLEPIEDDSGGWCIIS